jgi:hypothetical protein
MIGHTVNRDQLLLFVPNHPCDVFAEFLFVFSANQRLSARYGEYDLNLDLCVCVRHRRTSHSSGVHDAVCLSATNIPSLRDSQ